MTGSLKEKRPGSKVWRIILTTGYARDPETGKVKQRQKWSTFRGTKKAAEARLAELLNTVNHGEYVEPTKLTLGEWLTRWLMTVQPPVVRGSTHKRYSGAVRNAIAKDVIADIPIQKLRASDLELFYQRVAGSASTKATYHLIIHRALRKAVRDRLVQANIASGLDGRPRAKRNPSDEAMKCWNRDEARAFLATAKAAGEQQAALYTLALETGMRKSELCGLRWQDVDLEARKLTVVQQLTKPGPKPEFGPPKSGRLRTISLGPETVTLMRAHKRVQNELKMRNRTTYCDHGLVFAKAYGDVTNRADLIGQPLQANNLGERSFARLIAAAKVRPIVFHGLRHTCATLLLGAGEPVHVVAQRLGHSDASITMRVYAHVLPDMQQGAAVKLGAILHG